MQINGCDAVGPKKVRWNVWRSVLMESTASITSRLNSLGLGFGGVVAMYVRIRNKYDHHPYP